jgi:hypothetical protein
VIGPVIVLELNELTPALMDRFIAAGHLPGFARLRAESIACITDAEETAPNLDPWIQWATVHTGMKLRDHGVFLLGDGPKCKAPRIWDMVADAGKRAWICGSLNCAVQTVRRENLFMLPDPWATEVEPQPPEMFDDFNHLVRGFVQEYTRDKPMLSRAAYLRFARFMLANGISPRTVTDTLAQLVGERRSKTRWKRASILDSLQWDVFRHKYRQLRPALSTFFVYSAAHYQHFYWRNMEPELFALRDDGNQEAGLENAILHGYRKMDRIVQDAMALAGNDATVVLCTALSAQPLLKYDADGGKQIIRAVDIDSVLTYAGITRPYTYAPVMAEEFHLLFGSDADAIAAQERLLALRLDDGRAVMAVRRDGHDLLCGVRILMMPAPGTTVGTRFSNQQRQFHDLFYPAHGMKSGMHHPDGILWIRTPERRHQELKRKVSLRQIAPTLLALAGVQTGTRFDFPPMDEIRALAMA